MKILKEEEGQQNWSQLQEVERTDRIGWRQSTLVMDHKTLSDIKPTSADR